MGFILNNSYLRSAISFAAKLQYVSVMDNKTLFQLVPTLHFVLNLMQFVKLR